MNTITIEGQDVQVIEWKGQRVVTFAMVDRVHGRPEGTAGRNFRANRERFKNGVHFHEISADEIRRRKICAEISDKARELILLTVRGYLLLTKSFHDDRAWKMMDTMVETYFLYHELTATAESSSPKRCHKEQLPDFNDPVAAARAWVHAIDRAEAAEERCAILERELAATGRTSASDATKGEDAWIALLLSTIVVSGTEYKVVDLLEGSLVDPNIPPGAHQALMAHGMRIMHVSGVAHLAVCNTCQAPGKLANYDLGKRFRDSLLDAPPTKRLNVTARFDGRPAKSVAIPVEICRALARKRSH